MIYVNPKCLPLIEELKNYKYIPSGDQSGYYPPIMELYDKILSKGLLWLQAEGYSGNKKPRR